MNTRIPVPPNSPECDTEKCVNTERKKNHNSGHSRNKWFIDSSPDPQRGHIQFVEIFLRDIFTQELRTENSPDSSPFHTMRSS
ncbi:hypothetical protein EPI10_000722 [Gossypium australe]|uniref:Uncharacterized protein n=1 Tax=Gossypium australe TaxID=47621 RepID=A0A5B6V8R7_9ROSI|nr:hypothetical protein EPI10_000722 [Gossypium australe]